MLTAASGSLKKSDVIKAINAIIPQTKGGALKKSDVFVADEFEQDSHLPAAEAELQHDEGEHEEVQDCRRPGAAEQRL